MYETDFETNFEPGEIACEGLFPGMDQMEPGPVLAAVLSTVDVHKLSGYDRIVVLRAHQRMATYFQSHVYQDMAAITTTMEEEYQDNPDLARETAAQEIRVALTLTR